MPEWETHTRGVNRKAESGYYDEQDWDGKSCMDHHRLATRGIRDVESLTMLQEMGIDEESRND